MSYDPRTSVVDPGIDTSGVLSPTLAGADELPGIGPAEKPGRRGHIAMRWRDLTGIEKVGIVVFAVILLGSLLAPVLPIQNPLVQTLTLRNAPPSGHHLLGTDSIGRDVFSRTIWGGRSAFEGAAIAVIVMLILGVPWGLAAGFGGTVTDEILMRISDTFLSFPALVLAIGIIAVLGPSLTHSMAAVGVISAPSIARLLRSEVLPIKEAEFVLVSGSLGANRLRIAVRHVLPNAMAPVLVQTFALASYFLIIEAALGFLGLGVPPPSASWGQDLADAYLYFSSNPYETVVPGVAIAIAAWSISVVGDAIREAQIRS